MNAFHRRLRELGSRSFQAEGTPADGYRYVCLLATADPSRTQRIEVRAGTEEEAARLLLARAELWAQGK
jgi:hypothetical protein